MQESTDELNYLAPDFDPTSITIPRLRSILVAYNVPYPSSAKKAQLVQLFKENVTPKAKGVLAAHSRTKRSDKGITDIPSSQEDDIIKTEEDPTNSKLSSVRKVARRNGRNSPKLEAEGHLTSLPATNSKPSKKQVSEPRQITGKHGRASDLTTSAQPASRRSRPNHGQQHEGQMDGMLENADVTTAESPFSTDNPFQRSSSPLVPESVKEKRRKTDGAPENRQRMKDKTSRRKTASSLPQNRDYNVSVPSARNFEPSVSSIQKVDRNRNYNEPIAGEEFISDEQEEIDKSGLSNKPYKAIPRLPKSNKYSYNAMKVAPWAITFAMIAGFGTFWRQEKLRLGYCGLEAPSTSLRGVQIPDWASFLRPQCEPCPQHAYCYPELHTLCENGFVEVPHPLSLRGLVPLPPTCEPDTDAMIKVKRVADKAVEQLRERNAKWECGESTDGNGNKIDSAAISESELKDEISKKRKKGMSQSDFDDIWNNAFEEIIGREEVSTHIDKKTGSRFLRSRSLIRLGLSCAVRRSIRLTLAQYFWQLVTFCSLVASVAYVQYVVKKDRITERRAKYLASLTLDRLATHQAQHLQDPKAYPEGWISMGQLRDDILRNEFSASRRQKLWEKVQKKVEQNSNVRPMVRESRTGEVSRVWEWIGALGATESSPSGQALPEGSLSTFEQNGERVQLDVNAHALPTWDNSGPIY